MRPTRPRTSSGRLYGPVVVRRRALRPVRALFSLVVLVVLVTGAVVGGCEYLQSRSTKASREALPGSVWPAHGQAAFLQTGQSQVQAGPNQHVAAIASVAKVMTAYLVLRDHPLQSGQDGPTITLTAADVADTERRRGQEESVVSIAAGEQLTERQALQALLLPSANNIAAVLARWDAGSVDGFVARMNAMARSLGMTNTRYTDPSGYDDATVSTAADQVQIVDRAMRLPVFATIVATPRATLPVAGTVYNTDTLLGHNGFVGVKTGSDDAAGGCFAFRAVRWIDGRQTTITGVVLGQPGHNQIAAGLAAAAALVDRIANNLSPSAADGSGWSAAMRTWFGGSPEEVPDLYRDRSPITHADRIRSPLLIRQGRHDTRTPPAQLEAFLTRLHELGKHVEVDWFDAGHGYGGWDEEADHHERAVSFVGNALSLR